MSHRFLALALWLLSASGSPACGPASVDVPHDSDLPDVATRDAVADADVLDTGPGDVEKDVVDDVQDAGADVATDAVSDTDADVIEPEDVDLPDTADADVDTAQTDTADVAPTGGPCPMPAPEGYEYMVGVSAFGMHEYIEYIPGDLPIIIAAPHGGSLEPEDLPPDPESLSRDGGSLETALLVAEQLRIRTGRSPHIVINHIRRDRLNLNRSDASPNADQPTAIQAYEEFHAFVEEAKGWITASCGAGHYFDFHTNGHDERWVEVGLGLRGTDLMLPDDELDTPALVERSFYRTLAGQPDIDFVEVIRGPTSLGGLLEAEGIRVVPSPMNPDARGGGYFTGGFNSQVHGSRHGGVIDSSQLEFHFSYINAGREVREEFCVTMGGVMQTFVETHYGFDLDGP